jgi:hypothetical protein
VALPVIGAALSLSGRYAPFGLAIAQGLGTWQELEPGARLVIEDDASDPEGLARAFRRLEARCDLLLGPYSTRLMRAAAGLAADRDRVLWNHGGAGDDVQALAPGHVLSTLTPASRYAEPFLARLEDDRRPLWIAAGRGAFSRQVSEGAASRSGSRPVVRVRHEELAGREPPAHDWVLFSSGTFEEDTATVRWARALARPPGTLCSVAAGIQRFADHVPDPAGVLGVAQWVPGAPVGVDVGPEEDAFLRAHAARHQGLRPDYPAVQAAATASLALHCLRLAGTAERATLFQAATGVRVRTLFGAFQADPATGAQLAHRTVLVRWPGPEPVGG